MSRNSSELQGLGNETETRRAVMVALPSDSPSDLPHWQYDKFFKKKAESAERHGTSASSEMLAMLRIMREKGIKPLGNWFFLAIKAGETEGNIECAEQVFSEIRQSEVLTTIGHYNRLMYMYAKQTRPKPEHVDRVLELLDQLKKDELRPNAHTLCSVCKILGKTGRAAEAGKIFHGFVKERHRAVNQDSYRAAITAYAKEGKCDEARALFDAMVSEGRRNPALMPDGRTVNAMIGGYGNADRPDDARALFKEWTSSRPEHERVKADAVMLATLVKACSCRARLEQRQPEESPELERETQIIDYSFPADVGQGGAELEECSPKRGYRVLNPERVRAAEKIMREVEAEFKQASGDRAKGLTSVLAYSFLISDYMDNGCESDAVRLIEEGCTSERGIFNPAIATPGLRRKIDFHQDAVFATDGSTQQGVRRGACVAPFMALALLQYHRKNEHVNEWTEYIVGQHGEDVLMNAILGHLNAEHNPPVYGLTPNLGVIGRIDETRDHRWHSFPGAEFDAPVPSRSAVARRQKSVDFGHAH